MFNTEIKRISGVLAGAMIIWLFGQTLMISPLVVAVKELVDTNKLEHNLIIDRLESMGDKVNANKAEIDKTKPLLFRVVQDCREHQGDIENCKADFWKTQLKGEI